MSIDNPESHPAERQRLQPFDEGADRGFDTVGFLMRRKWLIAFGLFVGIVLGYLYFVKQPAAYQSSGRVLVVKQLAQMPISGGVAMDPSMLRQRDYLANDMFLIRSRDIIGPAVTEKSLDDLPTLKLSPNPVDAIIRGLTVSRVDDSADLLEVRFTGSYPDDCAEIVNAVMFSYRKYLEQQFANSSTQTRTLLTEARVQLNDELDQAAEDYRAFRKAASANVVFDGDAATNLNVSHIESTNAKLAQLLIQQRAIEGKLKSIDTALQRGGSREALRLMIDQTTAGEDGESRAGGLATIAKELFPLLLEEELLLETHGAQHPKVQSIRKKIELTEKFLRDQGLQQGTANKPDFLQVYIESLKLELDGIRAEQEELDQLMASQTAAVREQSELQIQHNELIEKKRRLQEMFDAVVARLTDVDLSASSGGYHAQIVAPAGRGWQVAPNLAKIMSLGAVLGALCGLLLGYVVESADQSFKSPEEISSLLGLQIIGHCPLITVGPRPKDLNGNVAVDPSVVTFYKPKSRGAEAFRAIRTALYFSTRGAAHKVIQVTSPHPGDGKSTLSSNLAVTIAQSGKRVMIVDADFRRPRVHKIFGVGNQTGMSSAIAGEIDIMDAIQPTQVANLDCLPCGPRPDNPSELLTSARFEELLALLREKYDFVLIDSPPVLAVTDPSAVAARVDGVLLCIRVTHKSRLDSVRATELLTQLDANILGIVVNGIDGSTRSRYGYGGRGYYRAGHMYGYGYGGYGYGYGYGLSDESAHPSHAKYFPDDHDPVKPTSRRQRATS